MMFLKETDPKGFSLIAVLVGIGVLGILAVVANQMFSNSLNEHKIIQQKTDREDLKRLIRITVDCPTTLNKIGSSCPAGNQTSLYASNTSTAITTPFSTLGKYKVRAKCGPTIGLFEIEYTEASGSDWKTLFKPTVPFAC